MPQLYTTKEDLTQLANAIREATNSYEQLTFPNGFIQKLDEIHPFEYQNQDWLFYGMSGNAFRPYSHSVIYSISSSGNNIGRPIFSGTISASALGYGALNDPILFREDNTIHYIRGYGIEYLLNMSFKSQLCEVDFPDMPFITADSSYTTGIFDFSNCFNLKKITMHNCQAIFAISNIFSDCINLKTANFPNCETIYGVQRLFSNCYELTDINFSKCSFISGNQLFKNCSKIEEIYFPECRYLRAADGLISSCVNLKEINFPKCSYVQGRIAYGCSNLTTLNFPACKYLSTGVSLVYNCPNLENFNFNDCETINGPAFSYCTIKNANFPNCTEITSERTFYACSNLISINFPKCNSIPESCFAYCSSLETVNLNECETIGNDAFRNCINIETFVIPNCVEIKNGAFYIDTNQSISDKIINLNLQKCEILGAAAFGNRKNLQQAILPLCSSISYNTFDDCDNLTYLSIGKITQLPNFNKLSNLLTLSCDEVINYASINAPKLTTVIMPKCELIGNGGFESQAFLKNINLPLCETVGAYGFEDCSALEEIILPKLTTIETGGFIRCTSLKTFTAPLLKTIGDYAFVNNNVLYSIDLSNCETIGAGAFERCYSLTEINLPNCQTINEYAFAWCSNITSVSIPVCTSLGASAFDGCFNLSTVIFNSAIATLPPYIFYSCYKLSEMSNSNILNIEVGAFRNCKNLTSITFENCTNLGNYAFANTKIQSVNMPLCTSIGWGAFSACYYLSTVSFSSDYKVIEPYTFYNCINLSSINLENCTTIERQAFENTKITNINLSKCTVIKDRAFARNALLTTAILPACTTLSGSDANGTWSQTFVQCENLTMASLAKCSQLNEGTFTNCHNLISLYLGSNKLVTLPNAAVFYNTPISTSSYTGTYGSIYVPSSPASLITQYKNNTNWGVYADRFVKYDFINNVVIDT